MPSARSEHLSWTTQLLYGAPSFAGAAMVIPIFINMPKFYSDVVLVPLGYLAIAIALARSLDALSDPIMGWISDRTRSPWGRRRPYLVIGAPLCGFAFWALMSPWKSLSGIEAAIWFGLSFVLYFLFHTVYVLPHYALGPELTLDYNERSSLFGVRESFSIMGTIVAAAAPGFLISAFGWSERQVFSRLGVCFALLLVALYWLLAWRIHERAEFVAKETNPFVPGIRRALRNRPFRILLASYVASSITGALPATLLPFFVAYVVQTPKPNLWLSILLLGYFGVGFLCMPLWLVLARRFGKLQTWLATFVIWTVGELMVFFFVGQGDLVKLLLLTCLTGSAFGAGLFLAPSMQADVIDYDELYTGRRREAQYVAFWNILPKFVAIPSAAIPIAILASMGYVPNAVQTPEVVFAIRALLALAPALCAILALVIAYRYPIDEDAHTAILEGIRNHSRGDNAVDPLTGRVVRPPNAKVVEEEIGWFLDYFSVAELKRYLRDGSSAPIRSVFRSAAIWAFLAAFAAVYAFARLTGLKADPGAAASMSVVVAGFALAISVFHLLRVGPARQLSSGAVPADIIRSHLAES